MDNNNNNESICIGITGGFASGKSTVASIVEGQGYSVVSTDKLAKLVMAENADVKRKLIEEFGLDAYMSDGSVNREKIAEIVFSTAPDARKKLRRLDQIVHPAVIDEMINSIDELQQSGEEMIFVESALIYEVGLEEGFDAVITVDADVEHILLRAAERGYSSEQTEQRLKEQISLQEKKSRADFVIENNGNLQELEKATLTVLGFIETMFS